jgi:hypothetical protein
LSINYLTFAAYYEISEVIQVYSAREVKNMLKFQKTAIALLMALSFPYEGNAGGNDWSGEFRLDKQTVVRRTPGCIKLERGGLSEVGREIRFRKGVSRQGIVPKEDGKLSLDLTRQQFLAELSKLRLMDVPKAPPKVAPKAAPQARKAPPKVAPQARRVPPKVAPQARRVPPKVAPQARRVPPKVAPQARRVPPKVAPQVRKAPPKVAPQARRVPPKVAPQARRVPPKVAPQARKAPPKAAPPKATPQARKSASKTPQKVAPVQAQRAAAQARAAQARAAQARAAQARAAQARAAQARAAQARAAQARAAQARARPVFDPKKTYKVEFSKLPVALKKIFKEDDPDLSDGHVWVESGLDMSGFLETLKEWEATRQVPAGTTAQTIKLLGL